MNGDDHAILVHEFKQGKYHVPIYSLCYRYMRNRADALEVKYGYRSPG